MILNILAVLVMAGAGLIPFLNPKMVLGVMDLKSGGTSFGLSEMRASVGGAWVFSGAAVILLSNPTGFFVFGMASLGAGIGRMVSLAFDAPPLRKTLIYGGIELAAGGVLIFQNWPL